MASQTQIETGRERREELYETIVELTAKGETDAAGGGVPMARLSEELGTDRSAIKTHVLTLREQDRIKQVHGRGRASPDGPVIVRASYLPADDGLRADGGTDHSSGDTDRLVLDVVVRENTRSETLSDFESLLREQFGAVYDDVECNVQTTTDPTEGDQ
ncbi:hypothetical protein [Natrinema thermotolerans]|uniref:hypothetical protein n=1 Tax=Natrinema thermotolerans TaxID=121872 RepID=UPI000678DE77|nr:hypothetical protein [Natrinema thermotolerans]QCC57273.1 hypothetical protein DVR14_00945 [Natrinema thermotolerans]